MKITKQLVLLFVALFGFSAMSVGQCVYELHLYDVSGDGWDDGGGTAASINVSIDGGGPDNYTFANAVDTVIMLMVMDGQTIDLDYVDGTSGNEDNSFMLFDDMGVSIQGAVNIGSSPQVYSQLLVDCGGPDTACVYSVELYDKDTASWDAAKLTLRLAGDSIEFAINDTSNTYLKYYFYAIENLPISADYTVATSTNTSNAFILGNPMGATLFSSGFNPAAGNLYATAGDCMDSCYIVCPVDDTLYTSDSICGVPYNYLLQFSGDCGQQPDSICGFTCPFSPGSASITNPEGIDFSCAPDTLVFYGDTNTTGTVAYIVEFTLPKDGQLSFDWSIVTLGDPNLQRLQFFKNGGFVSQSNGTDSTQTGTFSTDFDAGGTMLIRLREVIGADSTAIAKVYNLKYVFDSIPDTLDWVRGGMPGDTFQVGVDTVEWIANFIDGSSDTCFFVVTVEDTIPPVIMCANISDSSMTDVCYKDMILPVPPMWDSCGIDTFYNSYPGPTDTVGRFFVGNTPITWYAMDVNGNLDSCSLIVTILDTQPPNLVCTDTVTAQNGLDSCSKYVNVPQPILATNCAVNNLSNDYNGGALNASDIYPVGATTVTYTAIDTSGNMASCATVVVVQDTVFPEITCQIADTLVYTDIDECNAFITLPFPDTVDNCSFVTVINDFNMSDDASGIYPLDTTIVTWFAISGNGDTAMCSTQIVVVDTMSPDLTCPPNMTLDSDPGVCTRGVAPLFGTAMDNCGIDTTFNSLTGDGLDVGGIFPVGPTMIIFTARDTNGNESTCATTITIEDNEDPSIMCPGNVVTYTDSGLCETFVAVALLDSSDNCGIDTIYNDYNDGGSDASGLYQEGVTKVIFYIEDIHGNIDTCSVLVDVRDTNSLFVNCPGDTTFSADPGICEADILLPLPDTGDNCGILTVSYNGIIGLDASGVYPVGDTTITWMVTDLSGNTETCATVVTISDDELPQLTCAEDTMVFVDPFNCDTVLTLELVDTSDNCGIDWISTNLWGGYSVTENFSVGMTTVWWYAGDVNGNIDSCDVIVTVSDTTNPMITCPADIVEDSGLDTCGAYVYVPMPDTSDNCGIDTAYNSWTGAGLDASGVYPVGSTRVLWTVIGVNANMDTCSSLITVNDIQAPSINCSGDIISFNDLDECSADIMVGLPDTSDNCGIDTVYNSYTGAGLDASGVYPVGLTMVTWTVWDVNGLSNTCSININVIDTNSLYITCPDDTVFMNDPGLCEADILLPLPDTNDNCAIIIVNNDYNGGLDASGVYPVGATIVTWMVTDVGLNTSSCSTTVTVLDTENPVVECLDSILVYTDPDTCNAFLELNPADTSDNCGIDTLYNDYTNQGYYADTTYEVGVTTVWWYIEDIYGNRDSCSLVITVLDTVKPTITCQDTFMWYADDDRCGADLNIPLPVFDDNCEIDTIYNDYTDSIDASGFYPVGTTYVLWTVIDENDNRSTCETVVIVMDIDPPTLECPNNPIVYTELDRCDADIVLILQDTFDNCGIDTIYNTYNDGGYDASDIYPVGVTKVTWYIYDVNGLWDSCFALVDVRDSNNLSIVCPADTVFSTDPGVCGADILLPVPDTMDNCGITVVTNNKNGMYDASGFYDIGATKVIWTVVDQSGNTEMCMTTVTVVDDELPMIDCPGDTMIYTGMTACTGAIDHLIPDTSDNCGIDTIYNDFNGGFDAGGDYPAGPTVVTWYIWDVHGNLDSCSTTVTVLDTTSADIICPADIDSSAAIDTCGAFVTVPLPDTFDNCGVASVMNDYNGGFDASGFYPVGTTTVTWTVMFGSGSVAQCSTDVNVVDDVGPVITCPDNIMMNTGSAGCDAFVSVPLPDTSDNCCIDTVYNSLTGAGLDASGTFPIGTTTIWWYCMDKAGNVDSCSTDVVVIDNSIPMIDCPSNISVDNDRDQCDAFVSVPLPDTSDNCGIDTVYNDFNGGFDASGTYPIGMTTVIWTIWDVNNNSNSCSTVVTVSDTALPQIECPDSIVTVNDPGTCWADLDIPLPIYSDNCPIDTVYNDYNGMIDASGLYPVGETVVTWTIIDENNNSSTCSTNIMVLDTNSLYIVCPGDTTFSAEADVCGANIDLPLPDTADNCGIDSVWNNINGGFDASGFYPVGTTRVMWYVLDPSGNMDTCSTWVTVDDDVDPVIDCPADTMILADTNSCETMVLLPLPDVFDNCGVDSFYNDYTGTEDASGIYPIGDTKVTYHITDLSGNMAMCMFTVTILENAPDTLELGCRPLTILSFEDNCERLITPQDILESGSYGCPDDLVLVILDPTDTVPGNVVTEDNAGDTLDVMVIDTSADPPTACGGQLIVDDLSPPVIQCIADTIDCWNLASVLPPDVRDNCDDDPEIILVDTTIRDAECDDTLFVKIAEYRYIAIDESGNESDTCTQTIYLRRINPDDIVWPDSFMLSTGNPLSCLQDWESMPGMPNPEITGYPMVDTFKLIPGQMPTFCNLEVTKEDYEYPLNNPCVRKFERTWTILEIRCTDTTRIQHVQLIEVVDTLPPVIECPADITVTGTMPNCVADVDLPPAIAMDSCAGVMRIDVMIPVHPFVIEDHNGGTVTLPVGTHQITYIAYDSCNYSSTCHFYVTVRDEDPPDAVCKGDLVVPLGKDGTATICAEVFDAGSVDDCGIDSFSVRRMSMGCDGIQPAFASCVTFSCCDIADNPIMVIMRVVDSSGNFSECMVEVEIQDKLPPEYGCPSDVTISCEYPLDTTNLDEFGTLVFLNHPDDILNPGTDPREDIIIDDPGNPNSPVNFGKEGYLYDNCDADFEVLLDLDLDQCNVGTLTRTFIIRDGAGNIIGSCQQTITIVNFDPFNGYTDIIWPNDTTVFNVCSPDDLDPDIYGRPIFNEDQCDLVSATYEDCVFSILDTAETACLKVLRKWKVIDWCQRDSSGEFKTWRRDQVIKFMNNIHPEFDNATCQDQEICSFDVNCGPAYVELIASATDDCTPENELVYEYFVDINNTGWFDYDEDSNPYADNPGVGHNASGDYPIGNHRLLWRVEDKCGNRTTCSIFFEVKNCKQPSAICRNLSIDLTLMDMDDDNIPETPMAMILAEDMGPDSHHPCYDDVTISFSDDPTDSLRSFNCDFADETVELEIWVTDENGNQDFCTAELTIQDNNDLCPDNPNIGTVSGSVYTEDDLMLEDAFVHLHGSGLNPDLTDEDGEYSFDGMPYGGSYTVDPEKNDDVMNGVTTIDLALIQRHILGLELLVGPYKQIAADIDRSDQINILDIVELRKLILGIQTEFTNNQSWRFVDAEFVFVTNNPLTEPFNEYVDIPQFQDNMDVNFIAVKIGDVNNSVDPTSAQTGDTRDLGWNFRMSLPEMQLKAGEEIRIPIYAAEAQEILGFQATLGYNPAWMQIVGVEAGVIDISEANLNLDLAEKGLTPISWNDKVYHAFTPDQVLFELIIQSKSNVPISNALTVNSKVTPAEIYTDNGTLGLQFQFENRTVAEEELPFALYQNVPNPFTRATSIGYRVPKAMNVKLTIYNSSGKVLLEEEIQAKAGYNAYQITKEQLKHPSGLLYYRLEAEGFTAMKRMVGL